MVAAADRLHRSELLQVIHRGRVEGLRDNDDSDKAPQEYGDEEIEPEAGVVHPVSPRDARPLLASVHVVEWKATLDLGSDGLEVGARCELDEHVHRVPSRSRHELLPELTVEERERRGGEGTGVLAPADDRQPAPHHLAPLAHRERTESTGR